jgi:hypothetical protein
MISRPNATLLLTATCAAILCCLAGCNKAPSQSGTAAQAGATSAPPTSPPNAVVAELQEPPLVAPSRRDPEAIAMQDKYIEWVRHKAMPAGMHRPTLPDPKRTDEAALMHRFKSILWDQAATLVDTDAALAAQGLKSAPGDKK